ncbi:unnamed protein product [Nesidiocoris tenuis]|uniref:Uncharacterized protein n=1 Tax=Nesidiocoris tenuis TaxID=355587 RepID=A0A6H5GKD5_9HEMI|nr:unnamed protein product [Nesidiocoris tenuis]
MFLADHRRSYFELVLSIPFGTVRKSGKWDSWYPRIALLTAPASVEHRSDHDLQGTGKRLIRHSMRRLELNSFIVPICPSS